MYSVLKLDSAGYLDDEQGVRFEAYRDGDLSICILPDFFGFAGV